MIDPTDSELNDLEAELAGLQPAALSPQLQRRVAEACTAQRGLGRWGWLKPALLVVVIGGAAAALVIIWARYHQAHSAGGAMAELTPVSTQRVLLASQDEGAVTLGDGTPARQFRSDYVQTVSWTDPRSHASVVWSAPREEVQIVPISYQ